MKNKRTYRSVEVQTVEKARLLALLPATLVIAVRPQEALNEF